MCNVKDGVMDDVMIGIPQWPQQRLRIPCKVIQDEFCLSVQIVTNWSKDIFGKLFENWISDCLFINIVTSVSGGTMYVMFLQGLYFIVLDLIVVSFSFDKLGIAKEADEDWTSILWL